MKPSYIDVITYFYHDNFFVYISEYVCNTRDPRRDKLQQHVVFSDKAPAAIGPYSQAIAYGSLLFISGQLGIDPASGTMREGIQEQARQALLNLKAILAESNSSLKSVLKTTVFLNDMNDFAAVNDIYAQFFPDPCPARSAIQVVQLPKGGLIEIEAIAGISP